MNLFCKLFIGCWSKPGQTSCQLSVTAYSPIHFLLISPTFSLHKPLLGSFVLLHTHSLYKNLRPTLFLLLCSGFSPFWHPSHSILSCLQSCLFTCLPILTPYYIPSMCVKTVIALVCVCVCVCARNTIFWLHKYYFWGFYVHIFADLVSVVCSSLLVKYSATEITILTTVFLCSICMQLSHNVWTQREMNRLIKYNFLFNLSNTTVTSKSEQVHWNWCENVNLSGGNSFHLKIQQQSQKRILRKRKEKKGWLNTCQTHKEPTESDFLSTQSLNITETTFALLLFWCPSDFKIWPMSSNWYEWVDQQRLTSCKVWKTLY